MFDSGEAATRIGDPEAGFWIGVFFGDEAVDDGLEVIDRSEDAALKAAARELEQLVGRPDSFICDRAMEKGRQNHCCGF